VRCACIDIGSNTTRLLVAEHSGERLEPIVQERAFTRLGRVCRAGAAVPEEVVAGLTEVVAAQARQAREAGAGALRAVATAALRRVANGAEVCAALGAAAGVPVELLSAEEEAALAFAGATWACTEEASDAPLGVVDVGGGSSELIVGTRAGGVSWSRSLALGSGDLADAHLHSDPPSRVALDAIRAEVAEALAGIELPPVVRAVAVGGSATSLSRLVGPLLDADTLAAAVDGLATLPAGRVAVVHDLAVERVRLLPAGILVLAGAAALMGPLTVAEGGLREGIVLALAAQQRSS
jgi:exopolyphosphatase/guanosine-5'-triphosphate,3'-diphosphate pyrophosphatase